MTYRFSMLALCAVAILLAGCPGQTPSPQPDLTGELARELEGRCVQRATPHMESDQAASMCQCVAANHRRILTLDELQLLLRDYRGEISDAMATANNDVNQLLIHDGMVAERCLEDPNFRIERRSQWPLYREMQAAF